MTSAEINMHRNQSVVLTVGLFVFYPDTRHNPGRLRYSSMRHGSLVAMQTYHLVVKRY
jgi:hypothetical protein